MAHASLAAALSFVVAAPAAELAPLRVPGQFADLCGLVSAPGADTGDGDAVSIDATTAKKTVSSLREAAKLALPRRVRKEIERLVPLYRKLATGDGLRALASFEEYIEQQCAGDGDGGTSGSGDRDAEGIDPCELVSLEDAEALAGTPLGPGVPGNPSNPSCTYTGPVTGPLGQVEVYVGAGAKKILDIDRELGHALTPLAGLDEAYAEENAVFVHQSGVWVAIRLVRSNNPVENQQPLEMLARKVAAEL
jgi:hypothetical protein